MLFPCVWCNNKFIVSFSVWILTTTVHDHLNKIVRVFRPFIGVKAYCDTKGIQNTEITWAVASDRSYRYTITDTSDNSVVESK